MESRDATAQEQERYWELSAARSRAVSRVWEAELDGSGVDDGERARREIEAEEAEAELEEFCAAHAGVAFRVFEPESVALAITPDVKPFLPDGY